MEECEGVVEEAEGRGVQRSGCAAAEVAEAACASREGASREAREQARQRSTKSPMSGRVCGVVWRGCVWMRAWLLSKRRSRAMVWV